MFNIIYLIQKGFPSKVWDACGGEGGGVFLPGMYAKWRQSKVNCE